MLSLRLFGVVSLTSSGQPVVGPAAQRRRLALLAILASASDDGVSREKLIWYLWPDVDSKQGRHFLADSVYALRKALSQESIVAIGDNLRLSREIVESDVAEFRRALARGDTEAAVALYTGPFLDGFFVADASEFEPWAEAERAMLARKYTDALELLARRDEAAADPASAALWWRRAQIADPLDSRIALCLMTALEASGDRTAALRHAHQHQTLVSSELGLSADPAIAALADRLRSSSAAPVLQRPSAAAAVSAGRPAVEESQPTSTTVQTSPDLADARPRRSGFAFRWVAAAAVIASLAGVVWYTLGSQRSSSHSVFVARFTNQTGDPALDPLGSMAADWIARGLMEIGTLEVFSPSWTVYKVSGGERQSARSAAVAMGAGTVVTGAYYLEGGVLRLQAEVIDAERGRLLQTLDPVQVPADSGTAGVDLLRQRVTAAVAARFQQAEERREITNRSVPPTYDAYREYLAGVELFSRWEPEEAARHFTRAWELDSTFHLARLYSILVAQSVGNIDRADSLIESMPLETDHMAPLDRALLGVFKADFAGDRAGALRSIRDVAAMTPGSQFVVGRAVLAVAANRPREARDVLLAVDPRAGLLRSNTNYWEWLTAARHLLGEHSLELRDVLQAGAQYPERQGGLSQEIRAVAALGRLQELDSLLKLSLLVPPQSRQTPGDLMHLAAVELRAHGHPAASVFGRALSWYRSLPPAGKERRQAAFALTLYDAGRFAEAQALYERLSVSPGDSIELLGRLGTLAARRGDRIKANQYSEALLSTTRQHLRGSNTLWRARIAAQLGDRPAAERLLREAFASGVHYGLWLHTDSDLARMKAADVGGKR